MTWAALGFCAARRGDREEAMRVSDWLATVERERPYSHGDYTYWRAGITAWLGDKAEAVNLLRAAYRQGKTYGLWLHRQIDFESLRGYPAFEEFVRPKD